jgi:hypothetical protein
MKNTTIVAKCLARCLALSFLPLAQHAGAQTLTAISISDSFSYVADEGPPISPDLVVMDYQAAYCNNGGDYQFVLNQSTQMYFSPLGGGTYSPPLAFEIDPYTDTYSLSHGQDGNPAVFYWFEAPQSGTVLISAKGTSGGSGTYSIEVFTPDGMHTPNNQLAWVEPSDDGSTDLIKSTITASHAMLSVNSGQTYFIALAPSLEVTGYYTLSTQGTIETPTLYIAPCDLSPSDIGAFDNLGSTFYVGGSFSSIGYYPMGSDITGCGNVAVYDPSFNWESLGDGVNGSVTAIDVGTFYDDDYSEWLPYSTFYGSGIDYAYPSSGDPISCDMYAKWLPYSGSWVAGP